MSAGPGAANGFGAGGALGAPDEDAPGVSAGSSVCTYMLQLLAGMLNGRDQEGCDMGGGALG